MYKQHQRNLLQLFFVLVCLLAVSRTSFQQTVEPAFLEADTEWADTTLKNLTLQEKIGQLLLLHTHSPVSAAKTRQIVGTFQPGGVLLEGITQKDFQHQMQDFRSTLKVAPFEASNQLVAMNNQFSDQPHYPASATISAINDDYLEKRLFQRLLNDFDRMGINCSLGSPFVVDEDQTASSAAEWLNRFNTKKILAVADAATLLEAFRHQNLDLKSLESKFTTGLPGLLFRFESSDLTTINPSLFENFITNKIQFRGLVFAEATANVATSDLLCAGVDVVVVSEENIEKTFQEIFKLVADGIVSEEQINRRVRKILRSKKWLNLDKNYQLHPVSSVSSMKPGAESFFIQQLYEKSIVLANNPDSLLPFGSTWLQHYKIINVGAQKLRTFENTFFKYAHVGSHLYRPYEDGSINALDFRPIKRGAFIVTLDEIELNTTIHSAFIQSLNQLAAQNKVVVVNFGHPQNLALLDSTIVMVQAFESNQATQSLTAQLLFGGIQAVGSMPVAVNSLIPKGRRNLSPITRFKLTEPEEVGIDGYQLQKIDDLIEEAISYRAMPGAQVAIAKDGKIIYNKAFGYHTYDQKQRVELTDLYDVASITKVAATTLAAMKLYESGELNPEEPLEHLMALPKNNTIGKIKVKDFMIHQSGLQRNMPIADYLNNQPGTEGCGAYFCDTPSGEFSIRISQNMYMNKKYIDAIWQEVTRLPRNYRGRRYLYSDVNFYVVHQLIESITGMSMDDYVRRTIYEPLGLRFCDFNPLERYSPEMMVPTQNDAYWRKEQLKGTVHDEAAALMGGVGGNAGLFSNAGDLAILFQMLMNRGEYGGGRFFEPETIEYFTSFNHGNHRGLGFDNGKYSYTASRKASSNTFGHTGFTGTCVWADPEESLVYVFLTNRIYPDRNNRRLKKMEVRRKIHDIVYNALQQEEPQAVMASWTADSK